MAESEPPLRDRDRLADLGSVFAVCFGTVAAAALFVRLGTHGPILSVESALGSIALRVAGADRLVVLGYLGVGFERIYLTGVPLLSFVAGIAVSLTDRRWSTPVAVLLGVAAAGTLTVLSGCSCGSGSTALLAERAAQAGADAMAPLVGGR